MHSVFLPQCRRDAKRVQSGKWSRFVRLLARNFLPDFTCRPVLCYNTGQRDFSEKDR